MSQRSSIHSSIQVLTNMTVPMHVNSPLCRVQGIDFDPSYSTMEHAASFIINIDIVDMHRINSRILDVNNDFQNTNVTINERVYVTPPPYYMDWFGFLNPNVHLNLDDGPFCLRSTNVIQGKIQQDVNGIGSLMQCLQYLNIRKIQLIMTYTSISSLMKMCPILWFLLMTFYIPLATRKNY